MRLFFFGEMFMVVVVWGWTPVSATESMVYIFLPWIVENPLDTKGYGEQEQC